MTKDEQAMLDGAQIFCPAALPWLKLALDPDTEMSVRAQGFRRAYEAAFEGLFERDKALQSLTPGGSEYVNNPQRCADYSTEQRLSGIEAKLRNVYLERTLRALFSNPHVDLGDLVYQIREREGQGWDGPAVKAWSEAVTEAKRLTGKEGA